MQNTDFVNKKINYLEVEKETSPIKADVLQSYYHLVRTLSQLLSTTRLYGFKHKIFKEDLYKVFPEINKLLIKHQSISFFESEGKLLVNRREIIAKDGLTKRLVKSLSDLDGGYIILKEGLTPEEFMVFLSLLKNEKALTGREKIKQYLTQKGCEHVITRSATYKVIEEDEKVVKKDEFLAVEELSFEIRQRFLEDLKRGEVVEQLKKEEQKYRTLAHNPRFLAKIVDDFVKDKNSPEELAKALWLIGDYLIGEIDSAKEEKINRKAIEELKKQIFALWNDKISPKDMKKHIQKTFAAISLASELKGLLALCQKHKENMNRTVSKIQKILETLPQDSQLHQKTKEKLKKIGLLTPSK